MKQTYPLLFVFLLVDLSRVASGWCIDSSIIAADDSDIEQAAYSPAGDKVAYINKDLETIRVLNTDLSDIG